MEGKKALADVFPDEIHSWDGPFYCRGGTLPSFGSFGLSFHGQNLGKW